MKWVATTVFLVALSACASTGGPRKSACMLTRADSSFAAGGPVYHDCAVDTKARLVTTNAQPEYRPTEAGCKSAEVTFVVDVLGHPEIATARITRSNSSSLGDALLAMLPKLRYEPATLNGAPVRQITTERRSVQGTGGGVTDIYIPKGSPLPSPNATPASQRACGPT